jgi:hypothetical protein
MAATQTQFFRRICLPSGSKTATHRMTLEERDEHPLNCIQALRAYLFELHELQPRPFLE